MSWPPQQHASLGAFMMANRAHAVRDCSARSCKGPLEPCCHAGAKGLAHRLAPMLDCPVVSTARQALHMAGTECHMDGQTGSVLKGFYLRQPTELDSAPSLTEDVFGQQHRWVELP